MKALIINNQTTHLGELLNLFPVRTVIRTDELKTLENTKDFDCIVISGGSNVPSALLSPEYYQEEMRLVKESSIPLLCICLGCEVLTLAYGGTLKKLDEKHRGIVVLSITDETLHNRLHSETVSVYEGHTVGIETMPADFIDCAHSAHGVEIIKHATRPIIGIQFHPEVDNNKALFEWIFETLGITKDVR